LDTDFDNVEGVIQRYVDFDQLEQYLGKTGVNKHSLPDDD
jgi:hypothetical protein